MPHRPLRIRVSFEAPFEEAERIERTLPVHGETVLVASKYLAAKQRHRPIMREDSPEDRDGMEGEFMRLSVSYQHRTLEPCAERWTPSLGGKMGLRF